VTFAALLGAGVFSELVRTIGHDSHLTSPLHLLRPTGHVEGS